MNMVQIGHFLQLIAFYNWHGIFSLDYRYRLKSKGDESYFPRSWYRGADFWGDVGCPTYMAQNKEQKEEEKTSFDLRY